MCNNHRNGKSTENGSICTIRMPFQESGVRKESSPRNTLLDQNPTTSEPQDSHLPPAFVGGPDRVKEHTSHVSAIGLLQSCCRRKLDRRFWILDCVVQSKGSLLIWMLSQIGAEKIQEHADMQGDMVLFSEFQTLFPCQLSIPI
jgi:hypothetical protein